MAFLAAVSNYMQIKCRSSSRYDVMQPCKCMHIVIYDVVLMLRNLSALDTVLVNL